VKNTPEEFAKKEKQNSTFISIISNKIVSDKQILRCTLCGNDENTPKILCLLLGVNLTKQKS